MDGAPSPELIAAYRATRYEAGDGGAFAVLDAPSPTIDALLDAHGARSGVFVTAWNPGSARRDAAANLAAHGRLTADLAGRRVLLHTGVGAGDWREEGLFVLDLPEEEAVALARRHGQVAIVIIGQGEAARLVLTGVAPAAV